ncbi:hypothetical protein Agabi119p4_10567 [Agaricus bisporus var. burnettii]|uniref:Uncharacterized protein n=1 Tax=Agaricus bisporus var. burnettii TaxID=192524 RepID=A0A8H7C2U1_AGABI|nr:hypothetical protein Agabi119p4_10567 [Agaricus bisporus var. burnettii]
MLLTVYAPLLPRHQSTCPWSGSNWVPELPRRHHMSRVQLSSRPHRSTLVTRKLSLIHSTHPSPLLARALLLDIVVSRTLLPPPQDSRCALSPDGSVTDPPPVLASAPVPASTPGALSLHILELVHAPTA